MALIISRRSSYCPNFATAPGKQINTGRSFDLRGVVETTIFLTGETETRGVKTMFPLYETNNNSDVVPQWFNMEKNLD